MGRGSPVCQQIREKIIEMFKNNVPQRKIGRDLDISPSTVHTQGSKLTFLLGSTGAPNFKKLGAPKHF